MLALIAALSASITIQCIGRTNSAVPLPQRIRLGIGNVASDFSTIAGNNVVVACPVCCWRNTSHAPLSVSILPKSATSTPQELAKARAALVGLPAASNAPLIAGPRFSMIWSACWGATPFTHTAKRRGAA